MMNPNDDGVVEEVRWAKYYSSSHQILLVGEGDFSFSHSLAITFGSGNNITATSNDTRDALFEKYKMAKQNVMKLEQMGATIIHEVDATQLQFHNDLSGRRFDRIIYNFPHCGRKGAEESRRMINYNKELMLGFFRGASRLLLLSGELHVSHKEGYPYSLWKLEELAYNCSLRLLERLIFDKDDYPGYMPKRGSKWKPDKSFPLESSHTYKFALRR